jgi:hypothetical protein
MSQTETKNPLQELADMLKVSTDLLFQTADKLPKEQRQRFDEELAKQGYDKKMQELKNKMNELKDLSKKY